MYSFGRRDEYEPYRDTELSAYNGYLDFDWKSAVSLKLIGNTLYESRYWVPHNLFQTSSPFQETVLKAFSDRKLHDLTSLEQSQGA